MPAHWPKQLPKRYATRPILSVLDVAEIGGISERAVQRYYVREFPNVVKVGPAFAIPTSDVEAFLARVNAKEKSGPDT